MSHVRVLNLVLGIWQASVTTEIGLFVLPEARVVDLEICNLFSNEHSWGIGT